MADAGRLAQAFLEQSPACCWVFTREGTFQAVYGNASAIFGKTAGDLKGRSASEALGEEAGSLWNNRLGRVWAGETLLLRERRGGSTWFLSVFPIRDESGVVYAGGLGRDLTPWGSAEQQLRQTVLSALKAQEFERRMASQFLHDVVGQNLTALGLQLDLIRMDLEGIAPEPCSRISDIQKMLEQMMEQVREYSYELNPSTVERAGLRAALDRLTLRIRQRFAGAVRIHADPSLKIDPKLATALYHIAQEAADNAAQHAGCSMIEIAVKSSRNGPVLEVRDDGKGFDPEDVVGGRRGLGLLSMEHYAAQAGLELSISSRKETGTVVRVSPGLS
ncbi:MAG TPA: ATP-binding protein [Bryobacteraceae bacterium]|nr:ATP-binding protein [Bryobacteraceae bacterium]